MISLTKIAQIENLDSVYNLVNPVSHTRLLFYVDFIIFIMVPCGNSLTTNMFERFYRPSHYKYVQ